MSAADQPEPSGTAATELGTEPPLEDPSSPTGSVDDAVALTVPGLGTVALGEVLKRPSLARGGEAVVRRGVLTDDGGVTTAVILKSRPATAFGDEGFAREVDALESLGGLGPEPDAPLTGRVPRLLRRWRDERGSHVLMDTLPGVSVVDLVAARGARDLDPELVADVVERLGATVAAAHARGLSHNDLSWGNVLVDTDDDAGAVRGVSLVDFGLATRLGDAAPRAATPGFIATRQWREGVAVAENDTASLARVAYSLLTRINPSRAELEPVARIRRDVGERASQLLHRAITDAGSFDGPQGPARRFSGELAASLRGVGGSDLLAELRRTWQLQLATGTSLQRMTEIESGLRHDLAPAERFAGLLEAARMWLAASASARVVGAGPEELRAKAGSSLADAVLALHDDGAMRDFRSADADLFRGLHNLAADFLLHRGLPPDEVDRRMRSLWLTWADGFEPHLRTVRDFRPEWVPAARLEPPPPPPYPVTPPDHWPDEHGAVDPAAPPPSPRHAPPDPGYLPPRAAALPVRLVAGGATVPLAAGVLLAVTAACMLAYRPDVPSWHMAVAPGGALAVAGLLRLRLRRWRRRRRLVGRHPDAEDRSRTVRLATAALLAGAGALLLIAPVPQALATVGDLLAIVVLAAAVLSLGAPTQGGAAAILTNLVAVSVIGWAVIGVGFQTWAVHRVAPGLVDAAYAATPSFSWPERAGGTAAVDGLDQRLGTGGTRTREVREGLRALADADHPSRLRVRGVGAVDGALVVAHSIANPEAARLDPTNRLVLLVPTEQVPSGGWFAGEGLGLVRIGDAVVGAWAPDDWQAEDGAGPPEPGEIVRARASWRPADDSPDRVLALGLLDRDGAEVVAVAPLTDWP
jgi:serine/threonine protein kinase